MKEMLQLVDDINSKMAMVAPELGSEYARYPLHRTRWLKVTEKTAKGDPCYIHAKTNEGLKIDYVFGPGPKGFGYYHLLTRAAYLSLYARLTHESPISCCCFMSKAARQAYFDYDDVKRIVFHRSRSSKPDDGRIHKSFLYDEKQEEEVDHNDQATDSCTSQH